MSKVSQLGEGPACIVGRNVDSNCLGVELHNLKDRLRRESPGGYGAMTRDPPKEWPIVNSSGRLPAHESGMRPQRNRNAPDAPVLTHEIREKPSSMALLDMRNIQIR